ncbi:replication initiation protein RepC [Methylorubrum extorquens]|nr:replication initiation protein RepC [Methylorubrum extorquens]
MLSALCAVWGEQPWSRLIVWPSNEHLSSMTGLSERAIRYALRDLVALELVTPKDSANGKRYAIRAPDGTIVDAFGLDLTPLVAGMASWRQITMEAAAQDDRRRRSFELLTCHRRAVSEALTALLTRFPEIEVSDLVAAHESLEKASPKRRGAGDPEAVLEAWGELRQMAEERFYQAASAGNSCRHIEQDPGSPGETCARAPREEPGTTPPLLPDLVAAACPVGAELLGANLTAEADVLDAGRLARAAIGAHPSAWQEACESLGALRAACLALIVAQRLDDGAGGAEIRIQKPGGYFRQLVRLYGEGRYALEAELMAMRRRKMT